MKTIRSVLKTYEAITILARVYRHNSTTFDANRAENVAEHSYSLAVLAAAIASDFNNSGENLDIGMVAQFASVHDLVEAYMDEGDISVYAPRNLLKSKKDLEKRALEKLETKVVHMNVILSGEHHARPSFAEYLHTEGVARQKIENSYSGLLGYFEDLCKMFRERPHLFKKVQKDHAGDTS